MRKFALIGHPLKHSFSGKYFSEKFADEHILDTLYNHVELSSIEQLPALLEETPDLRGLNVTIPYKELVIPYLDELSAQAEAIGAVNTIKMDSGKKIGYNTDYIGFVRSIQPLLKRWHLKALVLGTGGSSKSVVYGLKQLGIEYQLVSRSPEPGELSYADINRAMLKEYLIIINTTPVGMYPKELEAPHLPYLALGPRHLLFDLIYNPEETQFLRRGKHQGAVTKNGHEMLLIQAREAWKIWNTF